MAKSAKRRLKRRQQHQASQGARVRQLRQRSDELFAVVSGSLHDFARAAVDPAIPPDVVVRGLLDGVDRTAIVSELLDSVLADGELMASIAEDVAEDAGEKRAVELAHAVELALSDHVEAAWLAISLADAGGATETAERIADEAFDRLEALGDEPLARRMAAEVVDARWRTGSCAQALLELDGFCNHWPDDADLMELRGSLLARAAGVTGDDPELASHFAESIPEAEHPALAEALARLTDRSLLYRLREGVEAYITGDAGLSLSRAAFLGSFREEVREAAGLGPFDELGDWIVGLAAERFWLRSDERDDGDDAPTVLQRYATDPVTPPELAAAATAWHRHAVYGIWLGDWQWARDGQRLWVTDVVTRRRIHASFAPEQLESLTRWSALVGVLSPVAGTWRSGQSLLELSPTLADAVAESVHFVTGELAIRLAREHGVKPPRRRPDRRARPRPLGVLTDLLEPMGESEANLTAKVLGSSLPQVVAMAEERQRRTPALANSDGEPLELISARFGVRDADGVRRALLLEPDFEADDPSGDAGDPATIRWQGRQMTAQEAAVSASQLRAEVRRRYWGAVAPATGPQHYLRGTLHVEPGAIRVEVNSRARLDALSAVLRRLGANEPEVTQHVDPALDLPLQGGLGMGRSQGAEVDATWAAHWVDESVPALEGSTPRKAATDPRRVTLLERLLRELEHDADRAAAAGDTPFDVDPLRAALEMDDGVHRVLDEVDVEVP